MASRKVPHRGYFTTVNIECDSMGVCCVRPVNKRIKGEICGMDYKMPWSHFNVKARHKRELDRGWPVRTQVPRMELEEMIDAWGGDSGALFGAKRRARRRALGSAGKPFKVGDVVRVGKAYVGSGKRQTDGNEGLYTVVGKLRDGDYYLAHGFIANPTKAYWDVIVNESRLTKARRKRR